MFGLLRNTIFALCLLTISVSGQFYNGTKMIFGKNRIQYSEYLWSHYKYDKFNIYFYEKGKNLADYVARSAYLQLNELEVQFEYKLKKKIQFIVYNTQNQSKESNIGNYPDEKLNTGSFTRVVGNKVFLHFDGSHENFDGQIRSGISKFLVDEIIFGTDFSDEIKNETLIKFPDWYYEGLIAYLSENWSVKIEGEIKSYFKAGYFEKFNWLKGQKATLAGQSIWYFIADKYGQEAIFDVLYMSKIQRSFSEGIFFALGVSYENLVIDWKRFFKSRFLNDDKNKSQIDSNNFGNIKLRKGVLYQRLVINRKGNFYAFTTNKLSQQKVFIYDNNTKSRKRILRLGHKIDILPDYSFPILAWNSKGDVLSVFYESKGQLNWLTYNVETNKKSKSKLFHFDKILEASYSKSGKKIVVSAVMNGKTDVFVLDVMSRSKEQITNDFYDNRAPVFLNNDKLIAFSSNRQNTSMSEKGLKNLVYKHEYDIFCFDYSKKPSFNFTPQTLFRITNTPRFNETNPISIEYNTLQFLSDENGIINEWEAKIDSTVASVDTLIHYRWFSEKYPITNYNSNILYHSTNGTQIARIFRSLERNIMSISDIKSERKVLSPTCLAKDISHGASSNQIPTIKLFTKDSIKSKMNVDNDFIYTDYYLFLDEMNFNQNDSVIKFIKPSLNKESKAAKFNRFPYSDYLATKVKQRNYEMEFRTADISLNLNNRFLNPQYQRFSGGTTYPVPGTNGFLNYTLTDLLEDHLLTAGFRIHNLFSNEFYVSYNNRKKRLDKQYLFFRSTHTDIEETTSFLKNITYEGIYRMNYPFSTVDRISTTFSLRYDQFIPLSKDIMLLESPLISEFWPNLRMDYTFDNTRLLSVNLFSGFKLKFFTEFYQKVPQFNEQMLTFGSDLRYYKKIFKNLILANRLALGTSLGSSRLMFFMGGVDSWTVPKFNSNLAPSKLVNEGNYSFQTLANNMRGFIQNSRNGSSFFVFNSEIRLPITQILIPQSFNSDFLNNFQIIGFGDCGTSWSGRSPFMDSNSINNQIIQIGGEARTGEIRLKTNKEPIIGSFGFGLRTTILGYFIRGDWAWGIEEGVVGKKIFYLSLTTDF